MKPIINLAVTVLAFGLPVLASAQMYSSVYASGSGLYQPYIAVQAGISVLPDSDFAYTSIRTQEASFDTGYGMSIKFGTQVDQLRIEAQVQYAENDLDEVVANGTNNNASGELAVTALTANAVWVMAPREDFHPYVGAGVGVADLSINNAQLPNSVFIDDSDTVFAYQFIAGVELAMSPQVAVYAGYHYLATSDPEFETADGDTLRTEYSAHRIAAGLRYSF